MHLCTMQDLPPLLLGSPCYDTPQKGHLFSASLNQRFQRFQLRRPRIQEYSLSYSAAQASILIQFIYQFWVLSMKYLQLILKPVMAGNEIDSKIEKYVRVLEGARCLIIIDPYLYASSKDLVSVSNRFAKMISWVGDGLEEIITYTNGKSQGKQQMQSAVISIRPTVRFVDYVQTDLHDRFWIDPQTKRGIVFGTSLNGLGLRLAIVKRLSEKDVESVLNYLRETLKK